MEHRECGRAESLLRMPVSVGGVNAGTAGLLKISGAFQVYQQAVAELRLAEIPQVQAAFSREGPLSAWVVIWLMIYQRLHAKGTLSVAVREMLTGPSSAFVRRPAGAPQVPLSANTSAYSQARSKLPVEVAEKVSDWIFEALSEQPRTLPGLGQPLFLLDGSSILLAHSPDLVTHYPPPHNQHGASHWPVIRIVVAHDVVSGLAVRPVWGPMGGETAVSEQGLTKTIIGRLPAGCGVLADRNFGVFSMAWHATGQGHPCLFRLTDARAQKLNAGGLPETGTDLPIRWNPSRDDLRNNPEFSAQSFVEGRLLALETNAAGGKSQILYVFTTLTLPPQQILKLYGYRWNIETDLRSLKREVRLHMLDAQSATMVAKELILAVAAYNLTRGAMNAAAAALDINPRKLSFSQAQDTLNAFLPLFAKATTDEESARLMQQMLIAFSQSKLPNRNQRRSAPRTIWPRPCSFPKRKITNKGLA